MQKLGVIRVEIKTTASKKKKKHKRSNPKPTTVSTTKGYPISSEIGWSKTMLFKESKVDVETLDVSPVGTLIRGKNNSSKQNTNKIIRNRGSKIAMATKEFFAPLGIVLIIISFLS